MAASHLRILAIVLVAAGSERAAAQMPVSSSVIHTVSVTVPPRVKVEVKDLSTARSLSRSGSAESGMSLSVSATQGWVLAIAKRETGDKAGVEWSRGGAGDFMRVPEAGAVVARGAISRDAVATDVFLRERGVAHASPLLLTVTAP